jgi:TPP-dependent pyruvate/acetoin dehydrogenase alpha subunit
MKRYTPHTIPAVTPDTYTEMREESEGEWVKWNDPLVQAAPYMLDALEDLVDEYGVAVSTEKVKAAIAKAKGEGYETQT